MKPNTTMKSKKYSNISHHNNPYNKALTSWGSRYGKNGLIRHNIMREDEEFFQEHLEHVKKNQSINL